MSLTKTDICNRALRKIGVKRLVDVDADTTTAGRDCKSIFQQVVDELLEDHDWNFAEARAVLTRDTATPDFGPWAYQFSLPASPAKFLKMRTMNKSDTYVEGQDFVTEGDKLLTDQETASIVYTKQVTDTAKFPPLFARCVSIALAVELDQSLSEGKRVRELSGELQLIKARAIIADRANSRGSKEDAMRLRHAYSPSRTARFIGTGTLN